MLGSSILDVAIGMVFIYLLLSLIASTVLEALSAYVQARSANLEHGIRSLFSGSTLENGNDKLIDLIYTHGLIRGLYRDPVQDGTPVSPIDAGSWLRDRLRRLLRMPTMDEIEGVSDKYLLPAYIPARTFAITLTDILNSGNTGNIPRLEYIAKRLDGLCGNQTVTPPVLEGSTAPPAPPAPPLPTSPLCTNNAAEAIRSLLADATGARDAAEKFRSNLENWYNDAMDRVSGWYKKHIQGILLIIGVSLAILFNVDSIRIGRTLWFDRDARQGLVSAAGSYVQQNTPKANSTGAAPKSQDEQEKGLTDQMETSVKAFNHVSSEFLLPVGWHYSLKQYKAIITNYKEWDLIHIAEQLLGWIITGFALSLGAPFWFDTLNKFMVVRSTIKPQEKSLNEPSKS